MTELAKPANLITPEEAAGLLNVTPQTLAVWRSSKRYGLPYIKVGRLVRYSRTAIEDWLKERTVARAESLGY